MIINLPDDLPGDLPPGNHTVVIKYPGDENYDPFNSTDILSSATAETANISDKSTANTILNILLIIHLK